MKYGIGIAVGAVLLGWAPEAMGQRLVNTIGDVTVPAGKTLVVPVTGNYSGTLSYTATSTNKDITVTVQMVSEQLKLSVEGFGDVFLHFLEPQTPRTVRTIRGFVQAGYYDGLTFHRVIPGFMIQGGDPLGTGGGGPPFRFGDDFHPELIFAGKGQLAMANSGKDSNGSQFFITVEPARFLDFNHTLFGQVTRGMAVVDQIVQTPRGSGDRPIQPVVIRRAGMVPNRTDALLFVRSTGPVGAAGTIVVTGMPTDAAGSSSVQFQVQTVSDPTNDPPILGPVLNQVTPMNTPIAIDLSAVDIDAGTIEYAAAMANGAPASFSVTGNRVTVTPNAGYVGPLDLLVAVRLQGASTRGSSTDPYDKEQIVIGVGATPITVEGREWRGTGRTVPSGTSVATIHATGESRTVSDFVAIIQWGDGTQTPGTVTGSGNTFQVTGSHTYPRAGRHPIRTRVQETRGAVGEAISWVEFPPELDITTGGAVKWPGWAGAYRLQQSRDLAGWEPISVHPQLSDFDETIQAAAIGAPVFFRLVKP